jgi:hypothetical protein
MTRGMVHGYLLGRLILRSAGFGCMASMDMQDFIDVSWFLGGIWCLGGGAWLLLGVVGQWCTQLKLS